MQINSSPTHEHTEDSYFFLQPSVEAMLGIKTQFISSFSFKPDLSILIGVFSLLTAQRLDQRPAASASTTPYQSALSHCHCSIPTAASHSDTSRVKVQTSKHLCRH